MEAQALVSQQREAHHIPRLCRHGLRENSAKKLCLRRIFRPEKAARENLTAVIGALEHALHMIAAEGHPQDPPASPEAVPSSLSEK